MQINVKLFAILRERAGGTADLALHIPSGATVADAGAALAEKFPALESHIRRVAFAVNQTYVRPETPLQDGDELALIPPVSGG